MTESLSKIVERVILIVVCTLGPALFFLLFKSTQKEIFAEELTRDFLESVTSSGSIEADDYMLYRDALAGIDGFDTTLHYTTYHEEPVYGYYDKSEIEDFFNIRNVWDTHFHKTESPVPEDADPNTLRMQKHTNATALAKLLDEGLPIGNDIPLAVYTYTPFVPVQELYAGEYLATVVKVETGTMTYYMEADLIPAAGFGTQTYDLSIGGVSINASITATVWPREVTCPTCNNVYTCTKQVVDHYKATNTWAYCPYCRVLVRDITADVTSFTCPVGTADTDIAGITFTAEYYDGTKEMFSLSELSHNYSTSFAGEQDITVSYKGTHKTGVCKIITTCPSCTGCGTQITGRNAFDCSIYPLCADCMEGMPVYLGAYAVVPETFSDDAITEQLIASEVFPMGRNDYLNLTVNHDGARIGGKYSFLSSDKDIYYKMGQRVRRTGVK